MNNFNFVGLEGNLTRDPELSYTSNNTALCKFSIASNETIKKESYVSYFDVVAWGTLAEIVAKYQKKGSRVIVSGRLKQERYQTKDGQNRSKVSIIAKEVNFLSSAQGNKNEQGNSQQQQNANSGYSGASEGYYNQRGGSQFQYNENTGHTNDDIPF